MATQVINPFHVFLDRNGDPVDAGYIYLGEVNQNPEPNPVQAYWDEALTIPAAQPVRTINGYPSRAGTPSIIYLASDDFSITVRDRNGTLVFTSLSATTLSSLQQDLANDTDPNKGASLIGYRGETVADWLTRINGTTLRSLGVVGDGVADDSDALEAAILMGIPLDWEGLTIRVTRSIGNQAQIPGRLIWMANGASVVMDAPGITESVMYFELIPDDHWIIGRLTIDGNSQAFAGLYLRNNSVVAYPDGYGNFYGSDIYVRNIRRANSTFANGDGIIIRGGWEKIILDRPNVQNVILAPGAGTPGVVGVTGITTTLNSETHYPRSVVINDPTIRNVSSEDPAQAVDMDGIRFQGPFAVSVFDGAFDSTFQVNGGTFRDCWGRFIKSQVTTGRVSGAKFLRTTGNNTGIGVADIDFQQGAGYVEDIECYYFSGHVPAVVVNGGQGLFERKRPALKVDGINVYNHNVLAIPQIIQTFSPADNAGLVSIDNIQVSGAVERVVDYLVDGDLNALSLSNVNVNALTVELVRAKSSGSNTPFGGKVYVQNCINTGTTRPLLTHNVPGNAVFVELSEYACTGFTRGNSAVIATNNPGSVMRPYAVAGAGQTVGGSMRVQALTVAAGATVQFEAHGGAFGVYAAVLSINANGQATAFFGVSGLGTVSIASGPTVTVGTNVDPGAGTYRVWATAGGVVNVRNTSGTSQVATLFCMG